MSNTIAVVGTINYDRIILPDGRSSQGLGGILYNVIALAPYVSNQRILPIARVGVERRREVERLFQHYPSVDLSAIDWSDQGTNETVLTYITNEDREESLLRRVPPLDDSAITAAGGAAAVLVNLISGSELTPQLIKKIAEEAAGPIILDVQSLTLTFKSGSDRGYRNIPDWREWVAPAMTVKGNEDELRWMVGADEASHDGERKDLLGSIIEAGPDAAVMTRGGDGFAVAWRWGKGFRFAEFPAMAPVRGEVSDPTGCGDAFTSGYLLGLLRGEKPREAALLGGAHAAAACTVRGLEAMKDLPDPSESRTRGYRKYLRS